MRETREAENSRSHHANTDRHTHTNTSTRLHTLSQVLAGHDSLVRASGSDHSRSRAHKREMHKMIE